MEVDEVILHFTNMGVLHSLSSPSTCRRDEDVTIYLFTFEGI
jgi:hypothetical protein